MSEARRIDYSIDGRIAIIAMNRPPVNAIDHQMIDAIHDGLLEADANEEVRAVIMQPRSGIEYSVKYAIPSPIRTIC